MNEDARSIFSLTNDERRELYRLRHKVRIQDETIDRLIDNLLDNGELIQEQEGELHELRAAVYGPEDEFDPTLDDDSESII